MRYPAVWVDEGWIAEPSLTWLRAGHLGNPSHGAYHDLDRHMYWNSPLLNVLLAGVYALGAPLLAGGRLLSVGLGGATLLLWVAATVATARNQGVVAPRGATGGHGPGVRGFGLLLLLGGLAVTLDPMLWKSHRTLRYEALVGLAAFGAVAAATCLAGRRRPVLAGLATGLAVLSHPNGLLVGPAALAALLVAGHRGTRRRDAFLFLGCALIPLIPWLAYLAGDAGTGFATVRDQNLSHFRVHASLADRLLHEGSRYAAYFALPALALPLLGWILVLAVAIRRRLAPPWVAATLVLVAGFAFLPNKTELYLTLVAPFLYLLAVLAGARRPRLALILGAVWLVNLAAADGALLLRNRDTDYRAWTAPVVEAVPEGAVVAGGYDLWFAFDDHPFLEYQRWWAGDLAVRRPDVVLWGGHVLRDPVHARLREQLGPLLERHGTVLATSDVPVYGPLTAYRMDWDAIPPEEETGLDRLPQPEPRR